MKRKTNKNLAILMYTEIKIAIMVFIEYQHGENEALDSIPKVHLIQGLYFFSQDLIQNVFIKKPECLKR